MNFIRLFALLALSSCAMMGGKGMQSETSSGVIEQVWAVDVDNRKVADPLAYARPAVTGHGADMRIVLGGRDGRAHIYDLNGQELYRIALAEGVDSGAATLSSGLVVLADTGAILYGIDAMQGRIVWRFSLSSPLTGVPVAVGDDVLVQTSDNRIYRINAKGEKVWSFADQPGGLGLYLNASPLAYKGRVYALLSTGDAVSLHADTGDLEWRKQLLLDNNAAYLDDLKSPQAQPVWLPELNLNGNTARDVVLFSFYQGEVFALSRRDGSTSLRHSVSLKSAPLSHDGVLYIADTHGVLQAINRRSGTILWQQQLSNGELLGPVLWHGSLWLSNNQGNIFKVGLDGQLQAQFSLPGQFDRVPLLSSAGVVVHSSFGGLYLLR